MATTKMNPTGSRMEPRCHVPFIGGTALRCPKIYLFGQLYRTRCKLMDVAVVDNEHGTAADVAPPRRVLNAGSGRRSGRSLHSLFQHPSWREVRIDIDPDACPDIVGSITDMRADLLNGSFDAIWSSHSIEHLRTDEVPAAMAEFRRILKSDGFALITCPDLEAVASAIVNHGLDYVAYVSGVGPRDSPRHAIWTW